MSDTSGDEADSRTAAVGVQRNRGIDSGRNSQDGDSRPTKKQRRSRSRTDHIVNDFVPRGASFSANSLQVNPDETSSSGSSSHVSDDSDGSDAYGDPGSTNPHAGSTAPAISWNQGRKNAVRTSLGKRKAGPRAEGPAAKQFKAVNGAYWRSRSASVSSGASEAAGKDEGGDSSELEEGEIDSRSDSDDSVSLNSAADNSIMLNIGTKKDSTADGYDPESAMLDHPPINGHTNGLSRGEFSSSLLDVRPVPTETKEEAFQRFSHKYPTAPTALVDLTRADLETVAKYLHWDRHISEIDLQLPVGCTECQGLGHLAEVCPTKECLHCGAWGVHISASCPSWRRCPRCRERGHTENQCPSRLKGSAAEVPCDLCGSQNHVESQCDRQWKLSMLDPTVAGITVSLSCARCLSSKHLIGDCPSLLQPLSTSSFTLHGIDPNTITNTNIERYTGPPLPSGRSGPPNRAPRSKNRRGGNVRSPSPDSDDNDMLPRGGRRPQPPPRGRGRGAARGAIRFGNGVGSKRGPDPPQGKPPPRPPILGYNTRQRSLSPVRRGPPPPRGGGGGGNRGRGRGGKSRRAK